MQYKLQYTNRYRYPRFLLYSWIRSFYSGVWVKVFIVTSLIWKRDVCDVINLWTPIRFNVSFGLQWLCLKGGTYCYFGRCLVTVCYFLFHWSHGCSDVNRRFGFTTFVIIVISFLFWLFKQIVNCQVLENRFWLSYFLFPFSFIQLRFRLLQ